MTMLYRKNDMNLTILYQKNDTNLTMDHIFCSDLSLRYASFEMTVSYRGGIKEGVRCGDAASHSFTLLLNVTRHSVAEHREARNLYILINCLKNRRNCTSPAD